MPHSEDAAGAILRPHMDKLGGIFPSAWDRWEEFGESAPELRMQICPRTRASMLNNFAAKAAEAAFADMGPEVVLTDQPGFLLMIFESELHVRLKKYRGRTCRTSGILTGQRKLYEGQQPLRGFPRATNCVHGYVLKPDVSGYSETAIKCSTGKTLHWKLNVPLIEQGTVLEHRPAPTADVAEPGISSTLKDDDRAENGGIGG